MYENGEGIVDVSHHFADSYSCERGRWSLNVDVERQDWLGFPPSIRTGEWKLVDATKFNVLAATLGAISLQKFDMLQGAMDVRLIVKGSLEGHSGQFVGERKLYVALARLPFVKHICEIGFNAGHSASLWLLANPTAKVTMFDIWTHEYTEK